MTANDPNQPAPHTPPAHAIVNPENPQLPTNPAATVALVAGLVACLPATGLVAVPAGLLGLRAAGRRGGAGRIPATFGLVLGLINLLWYAAIFAGAWQTHRTTTMAKPYVEATGRFVMLVGDGNVARARTFCTDDFDDTRLTDLAEQINAIGIMRQPNPWYGGAYNGASDVEVQCEMKFDSAVRVLVTHWTTVGTTPKLKAFELQTPPSTQPTTQPAK